jgi:hypothetical protein
MVVQTEAMSTARHSHENGTTTPGLSPKFEKIYDHHWSGLRLAGYPFFMILTRPETPSL